jgi:hypothetical protein
MTPNRRVTRKFLATLGGAAATWPLAARAQPKMPVVGFLHVASANPLVHLVGGFRQGLEETGYIEGQNVAIVFRWAEGQSDRLPALAAELVGRQAAVIVAGGVAAAFAANQRPPAASAVYLAKVARIQHGDVGFERGLDGRDGFRVVGVRIAARHAHATEPRRDRPSQSNKPHLNLPGFSGAQF